MSAYDWLGLDAWTRSRTVPSYPKPHSFMQYMREHVREGFISVLLLVALATLAHDCHWFDWLTAQSMRLVHRVESRSFKWADHALELVAGEGRGALEISRPVSTRDKASPATVTVLRYTPEAFRNEFCGLIPVPRDPLAWAIEAMASALKEAGAPDRPVVGIDVDITEVPSWAWAATKHCVAGEPEPPSASSALASADPAIASAKATPMDRAIERLLEYADVVAITFDRCSAAPSSEARLCEEAKRRNRSMAAFCRLNHGSKGVRFAFATPDAYVDPAEPHYRFLAGRRDDKVRPPVFPSLGNLMARAAMKRPNDPDSALTFLCDAVLPETTSEAGADRMAELLGDARYPGTGPRADYKWKFLDLLRGSVRAVTVAVGGRSELIEVVKRESERWKGRSADQGLRPMLMLSLDDGHTDRFFTVMDMSDSTGGDYIHAVTALSLIEPLEEHADRSLWVAALHDLLIGLMYLLIWQMAAFAVGLLRWRGHVWWAGACTVAGPLLLGLALGAFTMVCSAYELRTPVWNDPVLILIGLVLHTYLTMWESEELALAERSSRGHSMRSGDASAARAWSYLRLYVVVCVGGLIILRAMSLPGICS